MTCSSAGGRDAGSTGCSARSSPSATALQRFFDAGAARGRRRCAARRARHSASATSAVDRRAGLAAAGLGERRVSDYVALANGSGGSKAQERPSARLAPARENDPVERLKLLRRGVAEDRRASPMPIRPGPSPARCARRSRALPRRSLTAAIMSDASGPDCKVTAHVGGDAGGADAGRPA